MLSLTILCCSFFIVLLLFVVKIFYRHPCQLNSIPFKTDLFPRSTSSAPASTRTGWKGRRRSPTSTKGLSSKTFKPAFRLHHRRRRASAFTSNGITTLKTEPLSWETAAAAPFVGRRCTKAPPPPSPSDRAETRKEASLRG